MPTEIDHEYTEEIVCPYCGEVHEDSWDFADSDSDFECWSCLKRFSFTRHTIVAYSSWKNEPQKGHRAGEADSPSEE